MNNFIFSPVHNLLFQVFRAICSNCFELLPSRSDVIFVSLTSVIPTTEKLYLKFKCNVPLIASFLVPRLFT